MEINWGEMIFQVALVVAVVNWIKHLSKDKLGMWSVAVSMGVAFIVVFLAALPVIPAWYEIIKTGLIVGLSASGFYTLAGKVGVPNVRNDYMDDDLFS